MKYVSTPSVRRPHAVSNCMALYLIADNGQPKTFIQFIYIQNSIREKYLIKLFIQYVYEYPSTKSHSRSAGCIGVMVASSERLVVMVASSERLVVMVVSSERLVVMVASSERLVVMVASSERLVIRVLTHRRNYAVIIVLYDISIPNIQCKHSMHIYLS